MPLSACPAALFLVIALPLPTRIVAVPARAAARIIADHLAELQIGAARNFVQAHGGEEGRDLRSRAHGFVFFAGPPASLIVALSTARRARSGYPLRARWCPCARHARSKALPVNQQQGRHAGTTDCSSAWGNRAGGVSVTAHPESDTKPIEEITVIGTTPLPGTGIDIDKLPGNIQSVTASDLAHAGTASLPSSLNRRLGSGISMTTSTIPFSPTFFIAGSRPRPCWGHRKGWLFIRVA